EVGLVLLGALLQPVAEVADVLPARGGDLLVIVVVEVVAIADGREQMVEELARGFPGRPLLHPVDEGAELAQVGELSCADAGLEAGLEERLEHRGAALARIAAERGEGRVPDAAAWRGDRADERGIVVRVREA